MRRSIILTFLILMFNTWGFSQESLLYWESESAAELCKRAKKHLVPKAKHFHASNDYDQSSAFFIFELAAKKGSAEAMYYLASAYEYGVEYWERRNRKDNVAADKKKAFELYKQSADLGYINAINKMAEIYTRQHNEYNIDFSYEKAFEMYYKAATLGDIAAENSLGMYFQYGWGVEQNKAKALEWYGKAAEHGDISSLFNIGYCYYDNEDYKQAIQWFEKYIQKVDKKEISFSVPTIVTCYIMLDQYNKANNFFHKRQKLHNEIKIENTANSLYNIASVWNTRQFDDVLTPLYLETLYDPMAAKLCFKKAAILGHIDACDQLGLLYAKQENYVEAIVWWRKAAEQGHAGSQYRLAVHYFNNNDFIEAKKWCSRSAQQGYEAAKDLLKKM